MTTPLPAISLSAASPLDGCTACGTQATVLLSSVHGRRCAGHAWDSLAAYLTRTIDRRFDRLRDELRGGA